MNVHQNAPLAPTGRALLAQRIGRGWTVKAAAVAAGVSRRTAHAWLRRHRQGGERRHHDRSSAPHRRPHATPAQRVAEIEAPRARQLVVPSLGGYPAPRRDKPPWVRMTQVDPRSPELLDANIRWPRFHNPIFPNIRAALSISGFQSRPSNYKLRSITSFTCVARQSHVEISI
jgi:hypothetical protein